jgi:hypothetical protein
MRSSKRDGRGLGIMLTGYAIGYRNYRARITRAVADSARKAACFYRAVKVVSSSRSRGMRDEASKGDIHRRRLAQESGRLERRVDVCGELRRCRCRNTVSHFSSGRAARRAGRVGRVKSRMIRSWSGTRAYCRFTCGPLSRMSSVLGTRTATPPQLPSRRLALRRMRACAHADTPRTSRLGPAYHTSLPFRWRIPNTPPVNPQSEYEATYISGEYTLKSITRRLGGAKST